MDQYLKTDLVLDTLEQLAELERHVLAIEAGRSDGAPAELSGSVQVLRQAEDTAASLGLRNIGSLSQVLADGLTRLGQLDGVRKPAMVGPLLTAVDTLVMLLEDVDRSETFDIEGQLRVVRECCGAAEFLASQSTGRSTGQGGGPVSRSSFLRRLPRRGDVLRRLDRGDTRRESEPRTTTADHPATSPLAAELTLQDSVAELYDAYEAILQQLAEITEQLPHGPVAETPAEPKLVSLRDVFCDLPRTVTELANRLGKQCDVVLTGTDTEVRPAVADGLRETVTHLVTNAVQHRMPCPGHRLSAGQNRCGRIRVSVDRQISLLRVRVTDDGEAIDPADVKRRALAAELITPEVAAGLSDRRALQMIFLSVLEQNSASALTQNLTGEASGCQFAGLDQVRCRVEMLGGRIDVDSQPQAGTAMTITLPLGTGPEAQGR